MYILDKELLARLFDEYAKDGIAVIYVIEVTPPPLYALLGLSRIDGPALNCLASVFVQQSTGQGKVEVFAARKTPYLD